LAMRLFVYSIPLLFLLSGGVGAFVYSCIETKYKLINSDFEQFTQFLCLVPQQGLSNVEALKKIYARADDFSISFADLLNVTCVERPGKGAWRITGEHTTDCLGYEEYSLILTSSREEIRSFPATLQTGNVETGSPIVYVCPQTGMQFNKGMCAGDGNITVYTGAGNGEAEHRYKMKSWRCDDFPEWIISLDNVITVVPDSGVTYKFIYKLNDVYSNIKVSPSDRVTVLSSGRSDNLQNRWRQYVNGISTWPNKELSLSVRYEGTFDSRFDGNFYINGDGSGGWTYHFNNKSAPATYTEYSAQTIDMTYATNAKSPQDIWESEDNFVVKLTFGEPAPPATWAPISSTDTYCGCDLDKTTGLPEGWNPTEIWIDVVVILDTSEAMGQQSLNKATEHIDAFIGSLTTNWNSEFYTRVGVIAMSDKAEVLYNLTMTKADKVSGKVQIKKGLASINVLDALASTWNMLSDNMRLDKPTRRVIYYMTDSEATGDLSVVDNLKTNENLIVIVNDFLPSNSGERPGLKKLASPGYYSSNIQDNYMASIQFFCKANCFCTPDKVAYANPNSDPATQASGGCLRAQPNGESFASARSSCDYFYAGQIASIHDASKADFVQKLLYKGTGVLRPNSDYYWIGYSKLDDGQWRWEDKSTDPYVNWGKDEPSAAAVAKCAYGDATSSPDLFWGAGNCNIAFPYVCEYVPCSVGYKCPGHN
ncbi:hypothetical protein PMAYCL1PPCAC_27297, partial [Pristionchus mayeri]